MKEIKLNGGELYLVWEPARFIGNDKDKLYRDIQSLNTVVSRRHNSNKENCEGLNN
jgi:hypothetical protein